MKKRCEWCGTDSLYVEYHDTEWGVPAHDDRHLFEMLILEGAQAGLSWSTILGKRESYRRAFDGFDPKKVAKYTDKRIARLLENPGIVRNRLKVQSAVQNARAFLEVNRWKQLKELPASTAESESMSEDLKRRGFNFVGPTICYAFMQAVGMVNDHIVGCYRYKEIKKLGNPKKST
jgi:DNA-3-methyladenine glycosylase I